MIAANEDRDLPALRPSPPSLDYTCSVCGGKLQPKNYTAQIGPDYKLRLTARHCGQEAIFTVYLGFGGRLFEGAPHYGWKRPLDDLP